MAGSGSRGPLWNLHKDYEFGRLLLRRAGATEQRGVVCCPAYVDSSSAFEKKYLVMWKGEDGNYTDACEATETEVKLWIQDEFCSQIDFAYVPAMLVRLQQNNWHATDANSLAEQVPDGQDDVQHGIVHQASVLADGNTERDPTSTLPSTKAGKRPRKTEEAKDNAEGGPSTSKKVKKAGAVKSSPAAEGASPASGVKSEEPIKAEEEYVVANGKRYPRDVCIKPGDKTIHEFQNNPTDLEGDFVVERIVDEEVRQKKTWYLVKWKGYELNPGDPAKGVKGDWEPERNLKGNVALTKWKKEPKPAYYTGP